MTESLKLVKNGVFPLVKDHLGNPLPGKPETGYNFAGTIQGEGKLAGTPVLFIRTSGCNLRCIWRLPDGNVSICDTAESSFDTRDSEVFQISNIISLLKQNIGNIKHIVISGGEPLLQQSALVSLCKQIKDEIKSHITIETNGTIFSEELINYVDLFSISPKLKGSSPDKDKLNVSGYKAFEDFIFLHEKRRLNMDALQKYIYNKGQSDTKGYDLQFKFVVSAGDEVAEINDIMGQLKDSSPDDILLMPLGSDDKSIGITQKIVAGMAISNGWRFSSRLHIDLFTNLKGT